MSGDDLSEAYASGDVFMMPSESETLGFVALEAMASGLPVVAVAAGGLTDILTNPGVTGAPAKDIYCCTSNDQVSHQASCPSIQSMLRSNIAVKMQCLVPKCIVLTSRLSLH